MAFGTHDSTPLDEREPNWDTLLALLSEHPKKKPAAIFRLFKDAIAPDEPVITEAQFADWCGRQQTAIMEVDRKGLLETIKARQVASFIDLEKQIKVAAGDLMDDASVIASTAADQPLKERYYALSVVKNTWQKLIQEKHLAIKAHAEKRESVGMFAKLMRGVMSGEFSMSDVENLKKQANVESKQPAVQT